MATVYTQVGEEQVTDYTLGLSNATTHWIAWGTDGTTASKSDTSLNSESAEARVSATTSEAATDNAQWVGTITSASNQTIAEAGLFTASSGGTMLIRGDFAGIGLNTDDKIEFTFQLQQS